MGLLSIAFRRKRIFVLLPRSLRKKLRRWCDVVMGIKVWGPDGFNFAFLKRFWELLKGDIRIMFDQFYGNSCLPKSLLSYFVTLIPKVSSPTLLSEFRLISLLGCLYKIIAKVLAKRLAKVMDTVISSHQTTFIKGRNLVDGV
jgi:hypothetical protein